MSVQLRAGRYQCVVTAPSAGWFGESSKKGTPYLRLPLIITDGQNEGVEVTYQGWLSQGAVANTIKRLKEVFGWDGDMTLLANQVDEGFFVNKPCSITVEEEEEIYEGKKVKKSVIKWLNKPGIPDKMMEANKALQLARQIMGEPDPSWDEKPEQATEKKKPAPELDFDDDVPF